MYHIKALLQNLRNHTRLNMNETKYEILVKTGQKECAGTDANVFVNIFGDKGTHLKYHLKILLGLL